MHSIVMQRTSTLRLTASEVDADQKIPFFEVVSVSLKCATPPSLFSKPAPSAAYRGRQVVRIKSLTANIET